MKETFIFLCHNNRSMCNSMHYTSSAPCDIHFPPYLAHVLVIQKKLALGDTIENVHFETYYYISQNDVV